MLYEKHGSCDLVSEQTVKKQIDHKTREAGQEGAFEEGKQSRTLSRILKMHV